MLRSKNALNTNNAPHLLNISCVDTKESLVYTQKILLCIHNKCLNVTPGVMLRHYPPLLRHYWQLLRHYWPLLRHYCATIAPLLATIAPLATIAIGHYCATIAPLLATIGHYLGLSLLKITFRELLHKNNDTTVHSQF